MRRSPDLIVNLLSLKGSDMRPNYVVSSNINCIGYTRGQLFIRFNSGQTYSYDRVPYPVFRTLKESDSVGSTFHRLVRGKFEYHKLDNDPFKSRASVINR